MPDRIGRYEIKGLIGRGGMGTVYHGYDPRFERNVAIKVLPPHLLDAPGLRARFEREAKTVAALEHPAIVSVYDFDEYQGQPFLVMQYMTGGTLSERLARGVMPTEEVARILGRIGSALDEAHLRGIVHRDLKPGNILFDRYGHAYLSDFGIVSLAGSAGELTGTGTIGTPGYMSPEQIQGQTIDGRTDIYALGVLAFEMLTGRKPYDGDTPAMIVVRQMTEPPPDLRTLRPDLPEEVNNIIDRSLARDKEQRPHTAGEVAGLLALAAQATTQAAAPLTAAAVPYTRPATSEKEADEALLVETMLVDADAVVGEPAAGDMLLPAASRAPLIPPTAAVQPASTAGPPASAAPPAGRSFPWLLAVLGGLALLTIVAIGAVVVIGALTGGWFGGGNETELAETDVLTAEDEPDAEPMDSDQEEINQLFEQAWNSLEEGNHAQAAALATEILARDPDSVDAYMLRIAASREMGDFDAAFADLEALIARDPGNTDFYIELAATYEWVGDPANALMSMERCLEIAPENDHCWTLKGLYHEYLGEEDPARESWQRAIELNPGNVEAHFNLANQALWIEENPEVARAYADQAVAAAGDDPYAYLTRAQLLREMGDSAGAAADFRRFLELVSPGDCPECEEEAETFLAENTGGEGGCWNESIFCVGLVTDVGEIGDKSFNQSAWEGVQRVGEELGAEIDFIETRDAKDYETNIRFFAENGYDVIATVGFALGEATAIMADEFPDIDFIGIDQFQDEARDNLTGLIFNEDKAGFLAGALAAMLSDGRTIAAVLGSDLVPPVVAFNEGYIGGANYIHNGIAIISTYHPGGLASAFTDPEWGATTAAQAIDQGAVVIFGAGGDTGNGALIEAARNEGLYCIGVDTDQWETVPEARACLVSSAMKLITPAVFDLAVASRDGSFPGGNFFGDVGLAPFHDFDSQISDEIRSTLAEIEAGLRNGSIQTGYNPGD